MAPGSKNFKMSSDRGTNNARGSENSRDSVRGYSNNKEDRDLVRTQTRFH